jgi:hypothetical protein
MPVEFLLKARSTELSAVEEFQTENELYIRIKEIRDAFNQLLCQAIYHRDFKEYDIPSEHLSRQTTTIGEKYRSLSGN